MYVQRLRHEFSVQLKINIAPVEQIQIKAIADPGCRLGVESLRKIRIRIHYLYFLLKQKQIIL